MKDKVGLYVMALSLNGKGDAARSTIPGMIPPAAGVVSLLP
ncbi:hypothetical protein SAMN05518801_101227 [Novosphingobium sp. CF614]|nr:hypothetical protein SAMN05518801_101227 [Novosphingobium sp. CF614]